MLLGVPRSTHVRRRCTPKPIKMRHLGRLPVVRTFSRRGHASPIIIISHFRRYPAFFPLLPTHPSSLNSPLLSSVPLPSSPPTHPPLPPPSPMYPAHKDLLPYTASCNPPRRAKRPSSSTTAISGPDRPAQALPLLAPAIPSIAPDAPRAPDDDDVAADVPQPKRRGRKPSSLSRAVRESMRRQNHSRIEKARRTKINDALAILRDLVPADAGRRVAAIPADESADEDDEDDDFASANPNQPPGKSKQKQEKEFKLEILEKAVLYVQELQEKVRVLEARGCPRCSNLGQPAAHRPKRKRDATPPEDDYDSHSSVDGVTDRQQTGRPIKRFTSAQSILPPLPPSPTSAPPPTRLPSISSWLPRSVADAGLPEPQVPTVNPIQLPTPPASGVIGPITSPQVPPPLRLELPIASLSTRNHRAPSQSSPSWTPEDESVASLLLRIKTSNSPKTSRHRASVDDLLAPTPEVPGSGVNSRLMGIDEMRVQTPGTLLGMTTDGPK
ncbi:hypothetical protein F5148DRAFT_1156176 [Russula earlei]|uniref:Uncharacterized protein n=1 Tax=Russula earlei TaxID=71964 RepID=A0ACC0UPB3_9AGAM|nr:hypothetical protein F5148DRAFT_1156176 [Russula earlei]